MAARSRNTFACPNHFPATIDEHRRWRGVGLRRQSRRGPSPRAAAQAPPGWRWATGRHRSPVLRPPRSRVRDLQQIISFVPGATLPNRLRGRVPNPGHPWPDGSLGCARRLASLGAAAHTKSCAAGVDAVARHRRRALGPADGVRPSVPSRPCRLARSRHPPRSPDLPGTYTRNPTDPRRGVWLQARPNPLHRHRQANVLRTATATDSRYRRRAASLRAQALRSSG